MGAVFEAACSQCGYRSGVFPEGYAAVWVDEPIRSPQVFVAGMGATSDDFASRDDANLVVLAHPLESRILKDTGHTYASLLREGRFVMVTNVLCAACGHLYGHRKLQAPGGVGCLSILLLGLIIGAIVAYNRASIAAGFAAVMATVLVVSFLVEALAHLYTRVRFRERVRVVESIRACPRCTSAAYCKAQTSRSLPCPECRAVTLKVTCVGRS